MQGKRVSISVIHDRILVKIVDEQTSPDGLLLVKADETDQTIGEITDVGADVKEVSPGQRVMFNRYSGTSLMIEDEPYRVLVEQDVLLIINKIEQDEDE